MFVNNELTERGLLHRVLERAAAEVTIEERTVWARAIDGAVSDAARSSVPMRNRVARPVVVLAAAPALAGVASALRNEDVAVTRQALAAVREFMTDGIDSPLYGRDPLAARRAADALRNLVLGTDATQRASATARHASAA
jgi:hypothetical protein